MAKLPLDVQAQIAALPRTSRARPPELLHMTLLAFVDLADFPPEFVAVLMKTLAGFEAEAFDVAFDTIVEREAVTLRASKPLSAARALQRRMRDFLKRHDFPWFGGAPVPHVTLNYHRDGLGDQRIDPIAWRVEEIFLIESIYGATRHEPRGRLPLHRPML